MPEIHQREKWWDAEVLQILGALWHQIQQLGQQISESIHDLHKIAFCRVVILYSHASFSYQSMSFKQVRQLGLFTRTLDDLGLTWQVSINDTISLVITSPPYPNRMSYIRELRPYMYWLGYPNNGRDAGELDWQAIGGTWGLPLVTSGAGQYRMITVSYTRILLS